MRELDELPVGMLDSILLARNFRKTYHAIQQAKPGSKERRDLEQSPAGQWLTQVEGDIAMERYRQRQQRG